MTIDPSFVVNPEHEVVVWAGATRRQLERWEPLVAWDWLVRNQGNMVHPPDPPIEMSLTNVFRAQTEHHFLLIAAGQLVKALRMLDPPPVLDSTVADELTEARDLNEHWENNQPVFNVAAVQPDGPPKRIREPSYRSGKRFAERNESAGPYCWWAWNGRDGPLITPNVPATAIHDLVATALDLVTIANVEVFIPPAADRPWHMPLEQGAIGWTPKLDAAP